MTKTLERRIRRLEERPTLQRQPAETISRMELGRRVAFVLALGAKDASIEPPTEMFKLAQRLAGILAKCPAKQMEIRA